VGLTRATGVQPRIGASYLIKQTGTVLRFAYSRTFETPYNENLILSSATGSGGLATNIFGAFGSQPLQPGRRNQFNAGMQQSLGRFLIFDGEYFWKYTDNAYDFDTLFNTPIHFPISWRKSKINGLSLRFGTTTVHGLQAEIIIGHTRARFFSPEVGGLIFNSPLEAEVFRIDHDQAFQQTTNIRYQLPKNGPWFSFTWRYDSGEVAGAVTSLDDALSLTAAEQAAIGFFCGSQKPSSGNPITSCGESDCGATRLVIPAEGTFNPDLNPPRIAPRHLLDLGVGTDNLFHNSSDRHRTALRFSVLNLTNNIALYNFLSTFSGTHFVSPRTYQAEIKFIF
jgi:outer membrane receptor protein involved in Fe transport